jgi:hypothetical protein
MNKSILKIMGVLSVVTALVGVMLFGTSQGWAQQKAGASAKQLVGTWTLVSASGTLPDGKKVQTFGPDPQGLLIFNANGRYSLQICRSNRAKFASNNREKGTPEENQASVHGCNPHWGKYSVNEKDRAIVFQIEYAMFPNWEGTKQERSFTITGNELKYFVPTASAGGTADVVWRRAK